MNELLLISNVVLWLITIGVIVVLLMMAQQIGLLHRRILPTGARMANPGPQIGDSVAELSELDLEGQPVPLGVASGRRTLLVFMSTTCGACNEVAPAVRTVARSERKYLKTVMVFPPGDAGAVRQFVDGFGIRDAAVVISPDLGITHQITTTPYALVIDQQGVLRAKGVINHLEHLESLLHAVESGQVSIEALRELSHGVDAGRAPIDATAAVLSGKQRGNSDGGD